MKSKSVLLPMLTSALEGFNRGLSAAIRIGSGFNQPRRRGINWELSVRSKPVPFSSKRQDLRSARTQITKVVNGFTVMQTLPSKKRRSKERAVERLVGIF